MPPVTTPEIHTEGLRNPRWSRVHKIQLIRREVREFLSVPALELLFSRADLVVEGALDEQSRGQHWFATVMVTLDLCGYEGVFREPSDYATARKVAELMQGQAWVKERMTAMLRSELETVVNFGDKSQAEVISLDHQARADGRTVFLEGDAVVSLKKVMEARA